MGIGASSRSIPVPPPSPPTAQPPPRQASATSPTLAVSFAGSNAAAHHTEAFEDGAVARRGQAISLTVNVSGAPAETLTWRASALSTSGASRPESYKCPQLEPAAVGTDGSTLDWGVSVVSRSDSTVALQLCTPPDAPIGRYELIIKARMAAGSSAKAAPLRLLLCFNPWSLLAFEPGAFPVHLISTLLRILAAAG